MEKEMRIETSKKNIMSLMREVWTKKHPVIFWHSDQEGNRQIIKTEVTLFDQYYFYCALDAKMKHYFACMPKDLFFFCESKDLSFKVEYSIEKDQIHFSLPFKAAVPELRQGKRFRFEEKDLNLIVIKNQDKVVESYNALDISYNGFSFLVSEQDLKTFPIGQEIQVSSLPFSREMDFFKFKVRNQALIYKQTLTKGAVYRVGAEFTEHKPALNIPFAKTTENAEAALSISKALNEKQLSAELSSSFFSDVDLRVKEIFLKNAHLEERFFWSIHQLSTYILNPSAIYQSELNKLSSEELFSLLHCASSVLLKKYLLVMDQRHRQYFYQNVHKKIPVEKMLEIQTRFLHFVQVSKAA